MKLLYCLNLKAAGFLSLAALLNISSAMAQDNSQVELLRPQKDHEATFSLSLENDIFSGEDDNYTNGFRAAFLSPENNVPDWLENTANKMPFFAEEGHKRWSFAIGQSMFTSSDITQKQIQVNDRPYAGWLYSSVGIISDTGYRLDNLQLSLGVVGPSALAGQTQDFVHHTIGSLDPQGWDNQLDNEVGIELAYERKWRGIYEFSRLAGGFDITPSVGASLGNVYTHASMGAVARFGYDLPSDYGPPMIRPNLPGSDFFVPTNYFGWYLFAGLEGKAVARNIFLDGNTFRESHNVDKNILIGGVQAGIAFTIHDTRVAYTHIVRSKEFKDQPQRDEFGAVTLSWRF